MKKFSLLFLMLFASVIVIAQRSVTGVVTSTDGEALIGANILVKGNSAVGTVTDVNGKYSLNVPDGFDVIIFSYTGFQTYEATLGASNVMDVVMKDGVLLDELVVTALGISREEKSLGYAVQEVGGEELSNSRETNIVNALNGKVAGVQISGTPSTIGGSSRITIRGANSFLGNNQPLFVIDGVPVDNSNFATNRASRGFSAVSGSPQNPYDYGNMAQDIDPESIESMSVLKGAAATALYGQRGANGVILITTKKGKGQKGFGVEINSSVSMDQVANLIPHQDTYGGGSIAGTDSGFNEVIIDGETVLYPSYAKDGSWGPKFEGQQVRHWDSWDPKASNFGETRPWVAPDSGYEDYFETGVTIQNSVALNGGNDQGSFRLGYTRTDQSGTFPNSELDRNSFTFNSDYKLNDRLKVGLSANYIKTEVENRNVTGYNNANPMQAFTQWWQTQLDFDNLKNDTWVDGRQATWNAIGPIKDDNDNFIRFESEPNFFDNPYWVRSNLLQEDTRNRVFGNANVTYNLMEGLDLSGRMGTDFYQFSTREGVPNASVETSFYGETERRFQENNLELKLNYNKSFGDISFNAAVGGNRMNQLVRSSTSNTVGGITLEGFYNISNSAADPSISTDEQARKINSVFGLASFGYKNWLYLDISARNDWSSTLPEENNSYFYPSVSLSGVISDIPGLDNLGPLSFAKVRLSYAQVGNDADPYSLVDVFSIENPNFGSSPRYAVPNVLNNPDLKPELTSEYEIGVDLRFLNNRLGLDVAYFDRTTVDQIFQVPVSATTGYTSRVLNAGEMRNWGWEMMLTATAVKTKDFSWDIGVNAFRQNNKVVELTEGIESIDRGGSWAADLRIAEGFGYMAVFGQDYIRENYEEDDEGNIIKNEGQPVVGENGQYLRTANRVFLGSGIADWTGGFNTTLNYKGVSLGALFDFQKGGVIHSTSLQWSKYSGMHPETVSYNGVDDVRAEGVILPGVKEDGSENDIPIDAQSWYQGSFGFAAPNLYSASFLKLREIRLGYTIPNRLLSNTSFRDINVSLFGRNLAILYSDLPYLDPQSVTASGNDQGLENAQIPSTRSFGLNIGFKF